MATPNREKLKEEEEEVLEIMNMKEKKLVDSLVGLFRQSNLDKQKLV